MLTDVIEPARPQVVANPGDGLDWPAHSVLGQLSHPEWLETGDTLSVKAQWNFDDIGDVISTYSGGPAVIGTAAGARPEGREFEQAVRKAWIVFTREIGNIATIHVVEPQRDGQRQCLKVQSKKGPWAIYWDHSADMAKFAESTITEDVPPGWLAKKFLCSDLLQEQLGSGPYSFAPATPQDSALYYGNNYPGLFAGMTTSFDFSGTLVVNGSLKEKMLFEYKYGKSSNNDRIDGNAHERLGFQILQYLEIAQRFPSCSLNVIAAQAFSEFRNKYHPGFNQQAARLNEMFQQVQFRFASCRSEYIALFDCFANFLFEGRLPPLDYRTVNR